MKAIIISTYYEIIRNRYFSLLLLLSIMGFIAILFLNILALDHPEHIILDFGLSFLEISGVFFIITLGSRILFREFEEKTLYLTLSRPIHRGTIILGKFFGFLLPLTIALVFQSIILALCLFIFHIPFSLLFFLSIIGIFFKLALLFSLTLLFSTLFSQGTSTFLTIASYIIGHSGYFMLIYGFFGGNETFLVAAKVFLYIFPNFILLNIKNLIHISPVSIGSDVIMPLCIGLLYISLILWSAWYIFSKKSLDHL